MGEGGERLKREQERSNLLNVPLVSTHHKHKKSEGNAALRAFEGLNSNLITQTIVPTKSKVLSLNSSKCRQMAGSTIPYEDSTTDDLLLDR